jgi:hypothetical protein
MPHQCTECGYTFPDGSKEMLGGCPECGGNTFQYHPDAVPEDPGETEATPPEREDAGVSGAVGRAADTVRDVFGGDQSDLDAPAGERADPAADPGGSADVETAADPDSEPEAEPETEAESRSDREDPAQADARSEVVDATDLPVADAEDADAHAHTDADAGPDEEAAPAGESAGAGESTPEGSGEVVSAPDESAPELSDLRQELNSQFESIRIVEPGQYELNLMELYDREEYIIALQENGRYVIEVPDAWRDDSEV